MYTEMTMIPAAIQKIWILGKTRTKDVLTMRVLEAGETVVKMKSKMAKKKKRTKVIVIMKLYLFKAYMQALHLLLTTCLKQCIRVSVNK